MKNPCEICTIIPEIEPEYTIIDTPYWVANLRNTDQTLLGTTYITVKRHVPEVDMLTKEEDLDFLMVRNGLLSTLRKSFQPLTFNLSCLKNDAFKTNPDHTPTDAAHVHYHLKPRYTSTPTTVNYDTFLDPMPGRYLELSNIERIVPSIDTALHIAAILRSNLPPLEI